MCKISVLTATYNRGNLLEKLYNSLLENKNDDINIEWLIMDDGSTDDTENIVNKFKVENKINVKYYKQDNKGKMAAINNLIQYVTGELIIECDSDDYFVENSFELIKDKYNENKDNKNLYALCFLKYDRNNQHIGKALEEKETTMFDLYFKLGENGEKALVYFADIRKKYKYKLEKEEKFITEARLHHELDLIFKVKCVNKPIMICEYQKDGYTTNYLKQFVENPYGYFKYFEDILCKHDFNGVNFSKRIYVIKHYILFKYLTKERINFGRIKNIFNKFLLVLLYIPGIIKSNILVNKYYKYNRKI